MGWKSKLLGGFLFASAALLFTGIFFLPTILALISLSVSLLIFIVCIQLDLFSSSPVSLLNELNELPAVNPEVLLTPKELSDFEHSLKNKPLAEQENLKKQLHFYCNYLNDQCAITLNSIAELKEPITVERISNYLNQNPPACKTYSKPELLQYIAVNGNDAKEPHFRFLLRDRTELQLYNGYPHWIKEFVAQVRSINSEKDKIVKVEDKKVVVQESKATKKNVPETHREYVRKKREIFYSSHNTLFNQEEKPVESKISANPRMISVKA